jgi:hypothetical protein
MNNYLSKVILLAQCCLQLSLFAQRAGAQPEVNPQNGGSASKKTECLRLLNAPVISVDPVTGSGEAPLLLTNQTEKQINAALLGTVTTPPNSSVLVEFSTDVGTNRSALYQISVPSKSSITAKVLVRGVWDDGEFDIDLTNHYGTEKIGKVHVKRIAVGIKLEGTDRLKLALVDGTQTRILVRNDDPRPYAVTWRLMNGEQVCEGPKSPVDLSARTVAALECTPQLTWGFARFANLLRPDQSHDGYSLLLMPHDYPNNPRSPQAIQALKVFRGEASVDYFTPFVRGLLSYPILIAILLLGGLSSLVLSYFVPNKLKRLTLRDQLLALAARTADLSTRIDSKLSVLARLERSRLSDLLKSRSTISPDFTTVATQCVAGITTLGQKVSVLEQMDLTLDRLDKKIAQGVPPTEIIEINQKLELAAAVLGKAEASDVDIQAAGSAVSDAAIAIDQLNQPSDAFASNLSQNIQALVNDINQTLATSPIYQSIAQKLPGPMRSLQSAILLPAIPPGKYVEVDTAAQKMRIIREYALLIEEANDSDRITRLTAREGQLVSFLGTGTWPALKLAWRLLREIRDDVFPERILELLRIPEEASIHVDPPVAYERSPLELSVCLQRADLNSAAARDEIEVDWNFGDGLSGKGWCVYHYFQIRGRRNSYELTASFRDPSGKPLTNAQGRPVEIKQTVVISPSVIGHGVGERTRLELLKLGIALLIAVFGLVSGAQDQIARLDVLPGIIAVFLVGFTADSVKRLLTT